MFISQQTCKGMKTTVNALIEVVKFLLSEDCEFVKDSVKILWKSSLGTREQEVDSVTTPHLKHLVTMTSLLRHSVVLHLSSEGMCLGVMIGKRICSL